MKNRTLSLLTVFFLLIPSLILSADLAPGEKRRIGSVAEETLRTIIYLWKDGRYEEIYDYGYRSSQISISKESFITQMKNKSWGLASSWETLRDIESEVESSGLVYVKAKIGFKRKTGGDTRFITETFEMHFDGNKWRVGLYKILSCPN